MKPSYRQCRSYQLHSTRHFKSPTIGRLNSRGGWSDVTQNATAICDALGRIVQWTEAGSGATPAAKISYEYDRNGNIRRTSSEYRQLDGAGAASNTVSTLDHWYRYDSLNRVVTAKGKLVDGEIVRDFTGTDMSYDKAGRRVQAWRTTNETARVVEDELGPDGKPVVHQVPYVAQTREDFAYDAAGRLSGVRIAKSGYTENGDGSITVTPPPDTGALKASYAYDAMGRLTKQSDWLGDGVDAGYERTVGYNEKGQISGETVTTKQGSDTFKSIITNHYDWNGVYALGAIVRSTSDNYKNNVDSAAADTSTLHHFDWWDGPVVKQTDYDNDTDSTSNTVFKTYYSFNGSGHLLSAQIHDGRWRTVTYRNDLGGQVLRRDEQDGLSGGDPHEVWYRFGGKQLGYTGNNGTLDTDYQSSIQNRTRGQGTGAFRFGLSSGSAYADFDLSVAPITSYEQGAAGGTRRVEAGETLSSIAASLWGDAGLWYKLAEANGMSSDTALVEGQTLMVPAGVMKSTHNALTFKPDDPLEALGETSPTTPLRAKPPKAQQGNASPPVSVTI